MHWQNLNDEGRYFAHGRARLGRWRLEWVFFPFRFHLGFDFDDEDFTAYFALPGVSLYLSYALRGTLLERLLPHETLRGYPTVSVVQERECRVAVYDGRLFATPWGRKYEWRRDDPWYVRGFSVLLNPFELRHYSTEVLCRDGAWITRSEPWEPDYKPDGRATFSEPYRYMLKSGAEQNVTASFHVDRMKWRPLCLRWTSLFEKSRTCIDVKFSDEVGERAGSYKGGCTGCSYEMLPHEAPHETLRRMERERRFE